MFSIRSLGTRLVCVCMQMKYVATCAFMHTTVHFIAPIVALSSYIGFPASVGIHNTKLLAYISQFSK